MASRKKSWKGKRGMEEQYAPLPYPLLKSKAWRSLSGAAVKVYLELHTRFNGGNNGQLHLSMNEAAEALGIGKATVQRAFAELQNRGFLVLTNPGNWYHRRAHDWRLTTKATMTVAGSVAATNDWRAWVPEKTGRGSNTEPSASPMVPRQNRRAVAGSATKPVRPDFSGGFGSEMEH